VTSIIAPRIAPLLSPRSSLAHQTLNDDRRLDPVAAVRPRTRSDAAHLLQDCTR
jgi:hypothetical protein